GDASRSLELRAAGDEFHRLAYLLGAHVVEQDSRRTAVEGFVDLRERLGLDLDRQPVDAALERRERRADAARDAEVVLLDEHAVVEAGTMVAASTAAHGVLLEGTEAGGGLAGVEDGGGGAVRQLDEASRERGDAAEPGEQIERDTLAAEDRAGRPLHHCEDGGDIGDRGSFVDFRLDLDRRVERAKDRGGDRYAAHHAGLLEQQLGMAARVFGHEREGRGVAGAEVLGQRRGDDTLDVFPRQLHRSSSGSRPGRTTRCPANESLSTGKSSRKWTPRLSSRAIPHAAIPRTRGCSSSRRRPRPQALRIRPASCQSAAPGSAAGAMGEGSASKRGPSSATRPARRPKTRHSSSEFEASRLAPWTPVHAHSPAAYSPGTDVRPSRAPTMPPTA